MELQNLTLCLTRDVCLLNMFYILEEMKEELIRIKEEMKNIRGFMANLKKELIDNLSDIDTNIDQRIKQMEAKIIQVIAESTHGELYWVNFCFTLISYSSSINQFKVRTLVQK